MARVDKPTLQCDRCKCVVTDLREMGRFFNLNHYHPGGTDRWDICPECWKLFINGFIGGIDYPIIKNTNELILFDGLTLDEYMALSTKVRNLLIGIPAGEKVSDAAYRAIFAELAGKKLV